MPDWRRPAPYTDDVERIPSTEILYRRISLGWLKKVGDDGRPILDSQAFQDLRLRDANEKGYELRCLSVGLGSILEEHGGPAAMLEGLPDGQFGIAALTAECVRADGPQGIMYAPEDDQPWHAIVFAKGREKRSGGMERSTARCATWWQLPSGERVT